MIAIFSQENYETTTESVIDWLQFYKIPFKRINGIEFLANVDIEIKTTKFEIKGFEDINVCWFRRWDGFSDIIGLQFTDFSSWNLYELRNHLSTEHRIVRQTLFKYLAKKKWLTHPKEITYSKLDLLKNAVKVGLSVPDSILTTSKSTLLKFIAIHKKVITKIISQGIPRYSLETIDYSFGTQLITKNELKRLPDTFSPSLFQKYIEKSYEIRIFFLEKKFYSMAIFSQKNLKTLIDFRNYDRELPNRRVPYQLPQIIEDKLLILIENMNYTTGSIDLIKSKSGHYVFLEINPGGQFGMVSLPCNYFLEEKIAHHLSNLNNEK